MTHGENKNVQKSIRLTDSAYSFIMSQHGDGFNEKLDKLLYKAFWNKEKIAQEVERLERRRSVLEAKIKQEESILADLDQLRTDVGAWIEAVKVFTDVDADAVQ